jgi:hypothetical protein
MVSKSDRKRYMDLAHPEFQTRLKIKHVFFYDTFSKSITWKNMAPVPEPRVQHFYYFSNVEKQYKVRYVFLLDSKYDQVLIMSSANFSETTAELQHVA